MAGERTDWITQQAHGWYSELLLCLVVEKAFLRAGYSLKWQGWAQVLGWGWEAGKAPNSVRQMPALTQAEHQPEGAPWQEWGASGLALSSNPGSEAAIDKLRTPAVSQGLQRSGVGGRMRQASRAGTAEF